MGFFLGMSSPRPQALARVNRIGRYVEPRAANAGSTLPNIATKPASTSANPKLIRVPAGTGGDRGTPHGSINSRERNGGQGEAFAP